MTESVNFNIVEDMEINGWRHLTIEYCKDKWMKYKGTSGRAVLTLCGVYGVAYLFSLQPVNRIYYSVLNVLLAVGIYSMLQQTEQNLRKIEEKRDRKRRICYVAVISFLFALSMVMGYQLQNLGMTDCGVRGKGMILIRALCLSVAAFPFANLLLDGIDRLSARGEATMSGRYWKSGIVFAVTAVVIFLCLIPVWLAYYPIIMSYDFHRQVNEAYKGLEWFYPLQPIAHTWLIRLFLQIGTAIGSYEAGIACMAVFQMVLYALVMGYATSMIWRMTAKKWPVVVTTLFLALFPYNTVLVVCTTKDTLFTILFTLFFLLFLERNYFSNGKKKILMNILLVAEGCLMMQFRNNAVYAVAVFMLLLLILRPKKEKLGILILGICLVLGETGMRNVIQTAIGTRLEAPKIEAYSVPIQQFARVAYYHGEELEVQDSELAALLEKYVPRDHWDAYYAPLADTIKGAVNASAYTENSRQFLRDWLRVGKRYPNEFLDAFLELTRGYWFWDDFSWAENLGYGTDTRYGVLFTYTSSEIEGYGSIEHRSKFPALEKVLEKIVSGNCFNEWPVLSVIFHGSLYSWSLFFLMVLCLYRRKYWCFQMSLLPFLYFGTMLLGPVVQVRYLFPIMVMLPVLAAFFSSDRMKSQSNENREQKVVFLGRKIYNKAIG